MAELGYARVSTRKQSLDRQVHALRTAGVDEANIFTDKHTSKTMERPGWAELCKYARPGDRITVHTLDRLAGNLRELLDEIEQLRRRGIALRTLADPVPIDTADDSPMAQMSVTLLGMFGEMRRTMIAEQAAHAREVAAAEGRLAGRPRAIDGDALTAARAAVREGMSVTEAGKVFGISPATAYRYLGPSARTDAEQTAPQGR